MNIFTHRNFKYDIIIWAVRWYCKYGISYRDLEEMLCERGVEVDHWHNLPVGPSIMPLEYLGHKMVLEAEKWL